MSGHKHLTGSARMTEPDLFPPALKFIKYTGWNSYFANSAKGIYRIKKAYKKAGYVLWLGHKALCEVPTIDGAAYYAERHLSGEWIP